MKFEIKIIVTTLTILIFTLLMNSVLILASFEKIYVNSLISEYELLGRNLKHTIERSLRFGKLLDSFKGMTMHLEKLLDQEAEIAYVCITRPDGHILYQSARENARRLIPETIPFPDRVMAKETHTQLLDRMYITSVSLLDRSKTIIGVVNISFSRQMIYDKLKGMALKNLKLLWVIMLCTSLTLIFFMGVFIVRPMKKEISEVSKLMVWPKDRSSETAGLPGAEKPGRQSNACMEPLGEKYGRDRESPTGFQREAVKIQDEMEQLGWHIRTFAANSKTVLNTINDLTREQNRLFSIYEKTVEIEKRGQQLLDAEGAGLQDFQKEKIEKLFKESRPLWDLVEMFKDMIESEKAVRSNTFASKSGLDREP